MKNHFTLSALLLLCLVLSCKKDNPSTPPATLSDVHLKTGLLLYLPFDGNIADSSGNGNTTAFQNGATLTYDEHGDAASAFGATGNGENILVTNNGSIKFDTAYTISVDFMVRSNNGIQTFLSMVNYAQGYSPSFELGMSVPGMSNFDFGVNDSTAGCDNYGSANDRRLNDTTSFIPQPESWYNAICIYHRGAVQVYINGNLISAQTGPGTIANLCPASQIVVGGWWSGGTETINGKLDEIRLYNRVLNADEIKELAKNFQ